MATTDLIDARIRHHNAVNTWLLFVNIKRNKYNNLDDFLAAFLHDYTLCNLGDITVMKSQAYALLLPQVRPELPTYYQVCMASVRAYAAESDHLELETLVNDILLAKAAPEIVMKEEGS